MAKMGRPGIGLTSNALKAPSNIMGPDFKIAMFFSFCQP